MFKGGGYREPIIISRDCFAIDFMSPNVKVVYDGFAVTLKGIVKQSHATAKMWRRENRTKGQAPNPTCGFS
jgi:hypothetical protein